MLFLLFDFYHNLVLFKKYKVLIFIKSGWFVDEYFFRIFFVKKTIFFFIRYHKSYYEKT